ncbi:hypothetical protein Ancab_016398 [Ancistrocladus abbreviatus]
MAKLEGSQRKCSENNSLELDSDNSDTADFGGGGSDNEKNLGDKPLNLNIESHEVLAEQLLDKRTTTSGDDCNVGSDRGSGDNGGIGGGDDGGASGRGRGRQHEMHILTERQRRKRMRNMFSSLQGLIPHLPSKADKSTVIDEAIKYIKTLEQTLERLDKRKCSKMLRSANVIKDEPLACTEQEQVAPTLNLDLGSQQPSKPPLMASSHMFVASAAYFQTYRLSSNVILSICGNDAQISVCSTKKPGLLASLCYVLHKFKLDVISAHISSDPHQITCMIHARVSPH